ncbi:hypothetical protein L0222_19705 [bacterium]|nr:hypothetical protein [bacterium]
MTQSSIHRNRFTISVVAAVILELFWLVAALQWPSTFVEIPDILRLPMVLLGVLFLICGLATWYFRSNRWTGIFLLYCLGAGIHWGGAIGSHSMSTELALFFLFVSFTAMSDAALLHLALTFPSGRTLARSWKVAIYSPAALALILAPAGFLPQATLKSLALLIMMVAYFLSIIAGLIFIVSLFRANPAIRRAAQLPLITLSMVFASIVALLGSGGILPGLSDAWNLAFGLIPISLALALISPACNQLTEPPTASEPSIQKTV